MRFAAVGEARGFFPGPPDLAIEIVSPGDRGGEISPKVTDYLDRGVRMVWIIDPSHHTVTVHTPNEAPLTLRDDAVLEGGSLLPAFACDIRRIFR